MMSALSALSPRAREVLSSIVETYIETGEPVASRTISRQRRDALSPASIRNVMADLYDEGYLEQPHTSAGRVPTEKAFRAFVESLAGRRLPMIDLDRYYPGFMSAESLSDRLARSSHLLMELTRNVGIAAAIPAANHVLDRLELVKLADRRLLMIIVTRDQIVRERVVMSPEEMSQVELEHIRNYLNAHFGGWALADARQELRRRLAEDSAAYDTLLRSVMALYAQGLLELDWSPELSLEGTSNLVGLDLHATRERMRELFRALEEKKRMLELLDRFLEGGPGELGVQVGLGEVHPALKPLALIGLNVRLPGGASARIAVLGPLRMNYERVMAAVKQVGTALGTEPRP